jgi:arylformamidase
LLASLVKAHFTMTQPAPPLSASPVTASRAAYLDHQYNNRLRVPDFMTRHVQQWQSQSAHARLKQECTLDVAYGPTAAEKLDIFPGSTTRAAASSGARSPAGSSVLVFIHGGYWRSLGKIDHSFIAPAFTQRGVCVVVPDYALCSAAGSVTLEDIVLQMVRSLAWVYRNIARYGGDPSRITVAGHSAGGHLAAMLAACQWEQFDSALPQQLVRNAISISGLHDLAPIQSSPYLQTDLKLTRAQVQRCSPAYFAQPRAPLAAVCGADESDEFQRQNRLIQTSWGKRWVSVAEALPGHNHFSMLETLVEPAGRTHQLAMQFLKS